MSTGDGDLPGVAGPTPSWYDLLGVEPDASTDEVREAWRAQIAGLDPTERRFAVLNQAAAVLLDPARRAGYDEGLAAEAEVSTDAAGGVEAEAPPAPEDADHPVRAPGPRAAPVAASPQGTVAIVPGWLLAGVAVVVLALVVATGVLWVREPSAGDVDSAARAARAAAERAVVPILSYDAADLEGSKAAAQQYLTGDLRKDYDDIFDGLIADNAPATKTVVRAELVRSSIVRAEGDRAQVFLLVNQARTNKKFTEPEIYKNWVTLTMTKVDGDWLVADLDT